MEVIPTDPRGQAARGWQVELNGVTVTTPISHMRFVHPQMGIEVRYGWHPQGYDALVFREPSGGGAVIIPYLLNEGVIYVGVVEEERALAGGTIQNVPRGFVDAGETHPEGAARELREETGVAGVGKRLVELGGGVNPNSAYFDTSGRAKDGQQEGVRFYALPIRPNEVEPVVVDGQKTFRFRPGLQGETRTEASESIFGAVFVPLAAAVQNSPDMYTSAAAGRLVAHLIGNGVLNLSGIERPV